MPDNPGYESGFGVFVKAASASFAAFFKFDFEVFGIFVCSVVDLPFKVLTIGPVKPNFATHWVAFFLQFTGQEYLSQVPNLVNFVSNGRQKYFFTGPLNIDSSMVWKF